MQLVALAAVQEIAVGIDESGRILRADVVHGHRHARAGGIGVSEEAGARIDEVERVGGEGRVARENIDPVPVGIPQAVLHERGWCE